MVIITTLADCQPFLLRNPRFKREGLEEVVLFQSGEIRQNNIPNGSVWRFNPQNHQYQEDILDNDVGCGMLAFSVDPTDPREAGDKFYDFFKTNPILGRGNHFVDFCSELDTSSLEESPVQKMGNIILLHTDGKSYDPSVPKSIEEAQEKEKKASEFRKNLGENLARILEVDFQLIGDWPHNSVEKNDTQIIYRKGTIKIIPEKIHVLPANLGEQIMFYTIDPSNLPPCASLPHGTGRAGPRGELKATETAIEELRTKVYIPLGISNHSLRTEHPSCYNNYEDVVQRLTKYIIPIGVCRILSYVGKI